MKNLRNLPLLLVSGLLLGACQTESVEPQLSATQTADARLQNRNFSAHLTGDEMIGERPRWTPTASDTAQMGQTPPEA